MRVDKWLWAVRLFKSRAAATDACRGGHVRLNGATAKPASPVRPGDRIDAVVHGRQRILEVRTVIDKRVGAPLAATCLIDHSPPPPERDEPTPTRPRGTGRPTKKDRRQLNRLRP